MTKSCATRFSGLRNLDSLVIRHSCFVIQFTSVQQKSSPEKFREKTSQRKARILRSRRSLSRRFGCSAGCRCRGCGRLRRRSRAGCFSCCRWARGCRGCRGFGCFGLLLARRKERGTGQNADVFFHSVNWKRHIALTDLSGQGSF